MYNHLHHYGLMLQSWTGVCAHGRRWSCQHQDDNTKDDRKPGLLSSAPQIALSVSHIIMWESPQQNCGYWELLWYVTRKGSLSICYAHGTLLSKGGVSTSLYLSISSSTKTGWIKGATQRPASHKMVSSPCPMLSAMSTESRGSGWSELPGNSFVAAWNVTPLTERGKRYHSLCFHPVLFSPLPPFGTHRRDEISSHVSPSRHTEVTGLVMRAGTSTKGTEEILDCTCVLSL